MTKLKNTMVSNIIAKFGENAKLGAFTEEMLSSQKLIASFSKENYKLEEYKKKAGDAHRTASRAAKVNGFVGGTFFAVMIGFSSFSWLVGFFMIKYQVPNPYYDRDITVYDIVGTY